MADTYPNQMVDLTVRMYLYRWRPPGELQTLGPDESPYWQHQLEVNRQMCYYVMCVIM